jgi:DNA polymerase-3 subunit epsilon
MNLNLERTLAVFDIESTGTNWERDRIIDLAVIRLEPDGTSSTIEFRFHPEMPIPPASTAVHGIRDEDVRDAPRFRDRLVEVAAAFENCDLAGFNIWRFDVPMLQQEFKRAGGVFEMRGRKMVDAQRIYHQKERRDLTAAVLYYCGESHDGAHGARADAAATLRVIERQLDRYADLPHEVVGLDRFCFPPVADGVDREGKVRWDAEGEMVLGFGKHQGKKLRVMQTDRDNRKYLEWMLRQNFGQQVDGIVKLALDVKLPRKADWTPQAEAE